MNLDHALSNKRDNNLNFIRLLAAYAVLFSHSYALYTGDPATEPLRMATGFSLGGIAVWVFFGISGLLICYSAERSSPENFISARLLRILPALVISAVATICVGAFVTTLSVGGYWKSTDTMTYLPRYISLYFMRDSLPGVFEHNPFPKSVNGSAWTLFYEVSCYITVFFASFLERRIKGTLPSIIAAVFVAWVALQVFDAFEPPARVTNFIKLAFPFALGMLLCAYRRFVPLSPLLVTALWLATWCLSGASVYSTLFVASVVYSTFYLAYVPNGLLWYNNHLIGDISYGIYIYAFTLQQTVICLIPQVGFANFIALVTLIIVPISYASWHFVERPALQHKRWLAKWLLDISAKLTSSPFSRRS